VVPLFHQ
jgi:hypothetical protein